MTSISELIRPAGDPEQWRDAARAWRQMGDRLTEVRADLNHAVSRLEPSTWSGDDADAFAGYWQCRLGPEFAGTRADGYAGVAELLDHTGQQIEEYNQLARALELAVALAIGASVLGGGVGTLFGMMELGVAAAETATAYTALEMFLALAGQALLRYTVHWASTLAFGLVTNAVGIAVAAPDHNPLNMDNWSIRGLAEAINTATIVGGLSTVDVIGPVAALAARRPVAYHLGIGGVAGTLPSLYNLTQLEHEHLTGDPRGTKYDAWWKIALFAGVSAGFTAGVGKVLGPRPQPDEELEAAVVETVGSSVVHRAVAAFSGQPIMIQTAELGFVPNTATRSIVPLAQEPQRRDHRAPVLIGDVYAPPPPVRLPPPHPSGDDPDHITPGEVTGIPEVPAPAAR